MGWAKQQVAGVMWTFCGVKVVTIRAEPRTHRLTQWQRQTDKKLERDGHKQIHIIINHHSNRQETREIKTNKHTLFMWDKLQSAKEWKQILIPYMCASLQHSCTPFKLLRLYEDMLRFSKPTIPGLQWSYTAQTKCMNEYNDQPLKTEKIQIMFPMNQKQATPNTLVVSIFSTHITTLCPSP